MSGTHNRNHRALVPVLGVEHMAFIDEYMRNGRIASHAYATIKGKSPDKSTKESGSRWLALPAVKAEIDRRVAQYAKDAGIERVEVMETLRDMLRFNPLELFAPNGGILPVDQWPAEAKNALCGYNAGTVTAAETIKFVDKLAVCKTLLEELRPMGERQQPGSTNIQVNVDKLLMALDGAPIRPE